MFGLSCYEARSDGHVGTQNKLKDAKLRHLVPFYHLLCVMKEACSTPYCFRHIYSSFDPISILFGSLEFFRDSPRFSHLHL